MFTEVIFSQNFNTSKVNLHVKFNAYALLSFLRYRSLKMALRARKLSGLSRNGPLAWKKGYICVWTACPVSFITRILSSSGSALIL